MSPLVNMDTLSLPLPKRAASRFGRRRAVMTSEAERIFATESERERREGETATSREKEEQPQLSPNRVLPSGSHQQDDSDDKGDIDSQEGTAPVVQQRLQKELGGRKRMKPRKRAVPERGEDTPEAPGEFGCQFCGRLFKTPRGRAIHHARCREAPRESLSDRIQTAKPKGSSNRGRSLKRASDSAFTQMAKTSRVTKVLQTKERSVDELPVSVEEAAMEEVEGMKGEEKAEEIAQRERSEQKQGVIDWKEEVGEVACNPILGTTIKCGQCGTEVEYEFTANMLHCYKHWERGHLFECPLCDYSTNDGRIRVKEHIREKHPEQAASTKPRSLEMDHRTEIRLLFKHCFAGWEQHSAKLETKQRSVDELPEGVEEAAMEEVEGMEGEERAEEIAQRERSEQQEGVMDGKEEVGETDQRCVAVLPEIVEEAAMEEVEGMEGEEKAEERAQREMSEQQQGVIDGKEEVGEVACNPTRGNTIKCFECGTEVELEIKAAKLHSYKHWPMGDLFECRLCCYSTNEGKANVLEHIREKHPAQAGLSRPRSLERDNEKCIRRLFKYCFRGWKQEIAHHEENLEDGRDGEKHKELFRCLFETQDGVDEGGMAGGGEHRVERESNEEKQLLARQQDQSDALLLSTQEAATNDVTLSLKDPIISPPEVASVADSLRASTATTQHRHPVIQKSSPPSVASNSTAAAFLTPFAVSHNRRATLRMRRTSGDRGASGGMEQWQMVDGDEMAKEEELDDSWDGEEKAILLAASNAREEDEALAWTRNSVRRVLLQDPPPAANQLEEQTTSEASKEKDAAAGCCGVGDEEEEGVEGEHTHPMDGPTGCLTS